MSNSTTRSTQGKLNNSFYYVCRDSYPFFSVQNILIYLLSVERSRAKTCHERILNGDMSTFLPLFNKSSSSHESIYFLSGLFDFCKINPFCLRPSVEEKLAFKRTLMMNRKIDLTRWKTHTAVSLFAWSFHTLKTI